MKLHFWGASQTVTGSKYLVSEGSENVMIDCGLFQGLKNLRLKNWEDLPMDPKDIDAVILTHAHLDHSGYIPLLIKNGFKGKIYATPATKDLCRILLLDSGYLQEEEAKFANRYGFSKHNPALPLYTRKEADKSMSFFTEVPFHSPLKISDQFSFEFFPAGHILGAASVSLKTPSGTIVFSGDLGRKQDPIMQPPEAPKSADILVVESTYGDRLHEDIDPMNELKEVIQRTIERGGTVVIPSFAVARAQLILFYLKKLQAKNLIPDVPIYLNSPMANSANIIFRKYAGEHKLSKAETFQVCHTADVISTPEESIALNEDKDPKIIIAASGMATGGRVLHHLKAFGPDPRSSIVFVGFQARGTRGDTLVSGAKEVKIHGEFWPIRAEVMNINSLSAHADSGEILNWIKDIKPTPKKIFITHGEPGAAMALKEKIQVQFKVKAEVPDLMGVIDL